MFYQYTAIVSVASNQLSLALQRRLIHRARTKSDCFFDSMKLDTVRSATKKKHDALLKNMKHHKTGEKVLF